MNQAAHLYLTNEGARQLGSQRKSLKSRLQQVADQLKLLQGRENPAENGDLELVQDERRFLERQFAELSYIVQHAAKIRPKRRVRQVQLGSTVRLRSGRRRLRYRLVGSLESNPGQNKISNHSPLGKALLGKRVQDMIHYSGPNGTPFRYRVEAVMNSA